MNEINKIDLDALVIRFGDASIEEIKNALEYGALKDWQIPLVEELLRHKEKEARNKPTLMYHHRKSPKGKVFNAYEVPALEKKGWVDSPNKFKKSIKEKIQNRIVSIASFLKKNWKFIAKLIVTILAFLIPALVTLFIYLDSKRIKSQPEINLTIKNSNIINQKK